MKINDMRKNGKLYGKLLRTITLCISLTLLVSTMIYYTYYTGVEKTQTFRSDLNNLTLTSREVISLTEASQSLSFQLYQNFTISRLLFYDKPSIYDVTAAMSELGNYLNSMPYIDSIYVYNPRTSDFYVASRDSQNGVYSESELMDKDILKLLNNYQDIKPFTPIPRTYLGGVDGNEETAVYTFLCFDAINWNRTISSAVIVNISSAWLHKEFSGNELQGVTYLLDDHGRFLSGSRLTPENLTPSERNLIDNKIIGNKEGAFVDTFQGRNSLISYTSPDSLGWQYVRITPYKLITKQTTTIRNTILLISAVIWFIGLLFSRILSKRLYTPIGRIVDEMNVLATEKRDNMYTLRQNTLRDLVLGMRPAQTMTQLIKLRQLGIELHFDKGYRLILLRMDRYADLQKNQGSSISPYKFAIMNIASEVCDQNLQVETVDMNDDSVLLLLNASVYSPSQLEDALVENLLQQIQDACSSYLKTGISSVYGPLSQNADELNSLYRQVKEASLHRMFYGHGSIINAAQISELQQSVYIYPADLEKKLVDALVNGRVQEAFGSFSEIVDKTREHSYHVVQLAVSRVTVTVKSVIDNIQKSASISLDGISVVPSLDDFETTTELKTAFLHLFEEIGERLADKRSFKQNDLIRQINEKITTSYMDPNLSLNLIADELDMSPIYISRVYKQQTLTAIMDVVMETRMQEVSRLLRETDLSVSAIAEQAGFTSSSYLHRMFKRHFSVTPIEYRRASK